MLHAFFILLLPILYIQINKYSVSKVFMNKEKNGVDASF